jgi:tetratricopeptide (TPR) repeat protein
MANPGSSQDRAAFQHALGLYEKGRVAEAVSACETLVRRSPQFAPALHLLGFIALQAGDLDRAARFLPAAVRADPSDPAVHHSLGLLFRAGGKPADAAIAFRAAMRVDPRHLQAANGLGLSLLDVGDVEGAERAFAAAAAIDPRHAETRHNLGLALERQGRLQEAESAYRAALDLKPDLLASRYALGRILLEGDRHAEAEPLLRECLQRRPEWADARAALAMAMEAQFRDDEAEALLRAAPDATPPAIAVNLANLLARRKRFNEALPLYEGVIARHPRDPVTRHNRANALAGMGRVDEAIAAWGSAIEAAPGYPDPHFALAQWLLARGDLSRGWQEFAWRPVELPAWLPRAGLARADEPGVIARAEREKSIELVEEQGLGDVIFYLHWAPWLLQRGWRVMLRVSPRLGPLLARTAAFEFRQALDAPLGVDRVALPMADLPRLVVLLGGPERFAEPLRVQPLLDRLQAARQALAEAGPAPYTGLTWRAGVARRAVGRDMLSKEVDAQLLWDSLDAPGTLVAMQRGVRAGELDALRRFAPCVADFESWTEDLESLLGLLAALDGYAGVSSTNVHLLALLGRRATIAVPHPPEWRWAGEGKAPSPWFPGFRVIRQGAGEPWSATFEREGAEP